MFRLLIMIVFISLVIAPSTAQPTNPPITPDNIAQLEEQHVFGRGSILNITYTPNGEHLFVDTPLGLWRYDAQDLSVEPELVTNPDRFGGYYLDGLYMVFYPDSNTTQFYVIDSQQAQSRIFEGSSGFYGFSADGEHIITVYRESDVNYYTIWEIATGETIKTLEYQSFSETLLTPENTRIVVELPYKNGVYWVWDRENHILSPSFTGDEQFIMSGAIFSPDGTRFITHDDRWAYLWDAITETMIKRLAPYEDYPNPVDAVSLFTPDSRYALTAGHYQAYFGDSSVRLYDAVTGDFIREVANRTDGDLIFSPDGDYLITENYMGSYYSDPQLGYHFNVIRTDTWETVSRIDGVKHDVIFNPNGQDMLIKNATLSRYELSTGTFLDAITEHYRIPRYNYILFSPDDRLLLIADDQIHLRDTQTGELLQALSGKGNPVEFRFSPDGNYLMNVTYGGDINVWETATGQLLNSEINYWMDEGNVIALHDLTTDYPSYDAIVLNQNPNFSPDGNRFISTLANSLYLRDTQTGELIHQQRISEGDIIVRQTRFNPAGTHITVIVERGLIQWWNINTWTSDVIITDAAVPTISADGRYVAYGINNEIWFFDTQTGENRLLNSTYRAQITYLAFSGDGQHLYSGTEGEISKWWNIETGAFVTTDYHMDTNGNGLALELCRVDEINRYCLINTTTQESVFTITGHVGGISYANFNHAGTQIVTTGSDGTIRLWGIGD